MKGYIKLEENGSVASEYDVVFLEVEQEGYIETDLKTNRPKTKWDEVVQYNGGEIVDGVFVVDYKIVPRFDEGTKTAVKVAYLSQLKAELIKSEHYRFSEGIKTLKKSYSEVEIESWDQQVREAESYVADNTTKVILLESISESRGVSVEDLANRIISKADNYKVSYGKMLGAYQKTVDLLGQIDYSDSSTWDIIDAVRG